MRTRKCPTVNAGSMADIAFLLLIFFLVATTVEIDEGINQQLATKCEDCINEGKKRNLLPILLDEEDQLFVKDRVITIDELRNTVKEFIDNNGAGLCSYCQGKSKKELSEHPTKAFISIESEVMTSYKAYVSVLNEVMGAYQDLRSRYASTHFDTAMNELSSSQLTTLNAVYPQLLVEPLE